MDDIVAKDKDPLKTLAMIEAEDEVALLNPELMSDPQSQRSLISDVLSVINALPPDQDDVKKAALADIERLEKAMLEQKTPDSGVLTRLSQVRSKNMMAGSEQALALSEELLEELDAIGLGPLMEASADSLDHNMNRPGAPPRLPQTGFARELPPLPLKGKKAN